MKELRVTYVQKFSISPHLFSFFFASFSKIFVFVFPIQIKMRGVFVGGNERKRERRECFLLFFFLPPSICCFFFEREIKKEVCEGVVMRKN